MDEKRIFDTERVIPTYFKLALPVVFSMAIVLLYTCLFQASGKPVQSLVMSLSRQGLLFVGVFLAVTALWQYEGFLIAQSLSDFLSAALALVLYRLTFPKER